MSMVQACLDIIKSSFTTHQQNQKSFFWEDGNWNKAAKKKKKKRIENSGALSSFLQYLCPNT